jgi:hypothetical protein
MQIFASGEAKICKSFRLHKSLCGWNFPWGKGRDEETRQFVYIQFPKYSVNLAGQRPREPHVSKIISVRKDAAPFHESCSRGRQSAHSLSGENQRRLTSTATLRADG